MRSPGHGRPGDRVLVCVSEAINTPALIRYARRVADRLHAPWTAIYVETARTQRLNDAERDRIADYLRLAERLGASTITIPGGKIADEVVAYAEANNITQIVIGKSDRSRWFEMMHGSVVHDLVRKTGPISVHVISAEADEAPAKPVATHPHPQPINVLAYTSSAGAVVLALGGAHLIERLVGLQSVSLVFLMAVLASAVAWGLLPALFACLLSILAYNFFFLPPLYTLTVADPENVVALFFFALVAIVVSNLTAATRDADCLGPSPRQGDRGALRLQPQARRHRHARRSPVGDRVSDLVDAQGGNRPLIAGPGRAEPVARFRLSTGRRARRGRHGSGALVLGA